MAPQDEPTTPNAGAFNAVRGALYARRGVLVSLAILGGLGLAAQQAWRLAEPQVRQDERYLVTPASVAVTPPPPWVRDDVVGAAFRQAGFEAGLSVLGGPAELEEPLAVALAAQPWVRDVGAITKAFPNRLAIELTYRRPLAAVQSPSGSLLPIDADAVLLPAGDFHRDQLRSMPRINLSQGAVAPPPAEGAPWADRRVAGAAALVDAFGDAWGELNLFQLRTAPTPQARGGISFDVFEIWSTGSTLIRWGAAPGFGPTDESSFAEKLARLRRFIAANGPLNSASTNRGVLNVQREIDFVPRVVLRDTDESDPEDESVVK